ncbi:hypothetical protein [Aeoliella mucimassa]|uniref:Uncharacterized protein n=1 Tax=Aeoliella mucimassa TaxID=2527972 RepID=A0A518AWM1_9BACT|nr:hypothetical protein [Aeoliella mucimassa]QDU59118.1 hypothetical protein Pan181_53590 [Aeoliella mucimassa]
MPEPHDPQPDLQAADERFVEALLSQALRPDTAGRERRIAQAMDSINRPEPTPRPHRASSASHWRWARLAMAATVLLALGLLWPLLDTSRSAHATVLRSLEVATARGPRHYRVVTIARRPVVGDVTVHWDLYVDGANRFAIRRPSPIAMREVWFGSNGDESWVVPPIGPVMRGDQRMLGRWLAARDPNESQVLHLSTVLEWMARDFDLESLDNERLLDLTSDDQSTKVECRHVRGIRRLQDTRAPKQIDVWADTTTGIARRVVIDWQLEEGQRDEAQFGRMKMTLDLLDEHELAEDWFDAAGHTNARRAR